MAIATLVSQCVGLIYLANKVYCCKLKRYLHSKCFKPKIDYLSTLFKQSVPIMFTMLMIMFGVFNIFYFVGQFGELATAGYGTAVRIEQVLLLPVIGLNTAVLSIAGQNFGARMYFRVKEVYGKSFNVRFWIYGISRSFYLFNFRNYNFFLQTIQRLFKVGLFTCKLQL